MLEFYAAGCVVAFILGLYEAHTCEKHHKNIDEFPGMICLMTLLSWIYVIIRIIKPLKYE